MKWMRPIHIKPSPWAIGAITLGLLMGLTGATGGDKFYSVDNLFGFLTARALLEAGNPELGPFLQIPIWGPDEARALLASPHGALYAKYNLGQPLLALPLLGVGRLIAIGIASSDTDRVRIMAFMYFMLPAVAMAGVAGLLYAFARAIWGSGPALGIVVLLLLATPAGPYGKYPFVEASVAWCWMLAYFLIFRRNLGPAEWRGFLSGIAGGWALFIREGSGVGLPALALYLWLREPRRPRRKRMLGAWGLGAALPIAAAAGYNFFRFGNPLQTGYFMEMKTAFPPGIGLYGLLASSGKGLIFYAPPVLAVLVGWWMFWKAHRPEALAIGLHVLSYWMLYGIWWAWHGGWAWGPRFLVPVLPLLLLSLGGVFRTPWGPYMVWALGLLGLLVQIPGFGVDFQEYYTDLLRERRAAFEDDLIFNPVLSPIIGQWRLLVEGRGLAFSFFKLERMGIPPVISWGYRIVTVLVLVVGLQGMRAWPTISALGKAFQASTGSWRLIAGGLLLGMFGLNARLWLGGLAHHWEPLCARYACQHLHIDFDRGIELVAWSPPPLVAHPGETLRMQLWWRVDRPVSEPYSVYVHFRVGDQVMFQGDHEHPAFLPLPEWIPGWVYPDPYEVRVPRDIPAGEYWIRIGLYRRHAPGGRIPTRDGEDGIWLPVPIWVMPDNKP